MKSSLELTEIRRAISLIRRNKIFIWNHTYL